MKRTYSNGLKKAVTFSYDDGILQDRRLVQLFNQYGIKSTFNLNYGLLSEDGYWENQGVIVKRLPLEEVVSLYEGHEIANHGLQHPNIAAASFTEKQLQIVEGKKRLEELTGKVIDGMAYPFGTVDDDMIQIMKLAGVNYGRTVDCTGGFTLPDDWYRWGPTAHHNSTDIFRIISDYMKLDQEEISVLYIWGHSYEFDVDKNWDHIEEICKQLGGRDDIWYCTNGELFEDMQK